MAALTGSVARRYARALFDIGVAQSSFEPLGQELADLADTFETSRELREALLNPVFRAAEKRAILDKVLPRVAPSPAVRRLALLLLDRNRIGFLPAIARAYAQMVDERLNRVRAEVSSAATLDAPTLDGIARALERRTGKKVTINATVDPALLGGVVARVGDLVFDGSLRTRLSTLTNRLLN